MTKVATDSPVFSDVVHEPPARAESNPMRVVMVDASCFSLPYDYSLCEALGSQGHRVILVRSEFRGTQWKRDASEFEVWNHFYRKSHQAKPGPVQRAAGKLMKAAEHLTDMGKFVSQLRELRPDVIHFQWLPAPLLDRRYLRELSAIAPLVLTVHNTSSPHGTLMQRLHQKLGWASAFRHFRAVIVHTDFSRRQIVERKWTTADRIHVVPHGVLDYYLSLNRAGVSTGTSKQVVMFFGCVELYKGLDVLIRAFAALPVDVRQQTQLLVAGTPNMDAAPLRQLARDLGIESQMVWRLNYIAEEEVPQLFREAALVVLPYRSIDQSGVLMTAVAFGKAIVASRIGGIPDVIEDGVHGLLVKPGDSQDLAQALQNLLTNPAQRRSMEEATGHLAKTGLSWAASAQKTVDVYREVVAAD